MASCRDYTLLTSRELDEPLPRWGWLRLRLHLLSCRSCARFRAHVLLLREVMRRRLRPSRAFRSGQRLRLSSTARARMRRALRKGDQESTG